MTKKFLVSLAAVAALSTSAMAYNVSELSSMSGSALKNSATPAPVAQLTPIGFNQTQTSNALIFPAYFAGNGWETTIRVVNTDDTNGKVAKVVLYDGKDSHEVRDFNIYLSPNDVWVGHIKVDSDGVLKIISTDDSTPLEDGTIASPSNPFSKSISSNTGYIEVIGMADTNSAGNLRNGHDDHKGLREAYAKFAKMQRTGSESPSLVFREGVIQNQKATFPYVQISNNTAVDITGDGKDDYNFTAPSSSLTGDVRITDTVNGKDMDMMAYKIDYNTTDGNNKKLALIYLEGEKANLADTAIYNNNNNNDYNLTMLEKDINLTSSNTAYLTYGDAAINNMYALLTNPFKRVYVQDRLLVRTKYNAAYYKNASIDKDGKINYGSTSLISQIFDESEKMMSAGQFSPATTPVITLANEVASTGYDVNDDKTLAYYLNQANAKGFKKGFVKLTNGNGGKIPGILTQMLATTAGNKVVTNWIVPQTTNK